MPPIYVLVLNTHFPRLRDLLGNVVFEGVHDRGGHFAAYEVPELLAVPVVAGLPAYLRWVAAEDAAE